MEELRVGDYYSFDDEESLMEHAGPDRHQFVHGGDAYVQA